MNCKLLACVLLVLTSNTAFGQGINITSPGNDSNVSPNTSIAVGMNYDNPGGTCNNVRLQQWLVDVDDNTVGSALKDTTSTLVESGTMKFLSFAYQMPPQPTPSARRWKITCQIRNGTSVKSVSSIYINSYASGGP